MYIIIHVPKGIYHVVIFGFTQACGIKKSFHYLKIRLFGVGYKIKLIRWLEIERAAACGFWIRIYRILRINLNVVALVWEGYYKIVFSFLSLSPMRYAAAKKMIKSNPLRINIMLRPKTLSAILKILIQNPLWLFLIHF